MDENTIKTVLRSDSRVKELIATRAFQLYQSRAEKNPDTAIDDADNDWFDAEKEIVDELTNKLIEAQAESWQALEAQQPGFQVTHNFATLCGFMLATSGRPTRADLYDSRYCTIGLSYITGLFQIGQTLEPEHFLKLFSNDPAIVQALLYNLRADPASPYHSDQLAGDLKVIVDNDADLQTYLKYAEEQARKYFGLFKQMLTKKS